jgi:ABC-type multidrug transport system ATPase subunit
MQREEALRRPSQRRSSFGKRTASVRSLEDVGVSITLTWRDLCYDVIDKRAKSVRKVEQQSETERSPPPMFDERDDDTHHAETSSLGETPAFEAVDMDTKNEAVTEDEEEQEIEEEEEEQQQQQSPNDETALERVRQSISAISPRRRRGRKNVYRRILDHVDGAVAAGEMVAILGPSGSGKTTLLNILAGRVFKGVLSGSIMANGSKRTKSYYTNTAYVEQDDLMFATLTVAETLRIAALLRLPKVMSKAQKLERVEEVIQELGLFPCRNTYIGGPEIRGISGGERKRTAIAVELLHNPSVLFLDEPTSGLDSTTAQNIIALLRKLSERGRTILTTIHQPKASILKMFHKVMLLSQGKVVFFGPVDELVPYFSSIGFPCPQYDNPADYYMDLITIDPRSPKAQDLSQKRLDKLIENYNDRKQPEIAAEIDRLVDYLERNAPLETTKVRKHQSTYWDEFSVLMGRSWKNFIRNKRLSVYAMIQTVFLALIVGGVFFGVTNGPTGIQNRAGAIFFIILNQSFTTLFPVLNVFPAEIAVFKRERAAQMYRVSTYYLSKNFAELPLQLLLPIIYGTIAYWMISFQATAKAFFTFLVFLVVIAFTSQSLGIMISAAVPNITVANIVAPLVLIVLVLFGGLYANNQTFWAGISWIQYLSYVNYAFKALMQNEFTGLVFCPSDPSQCTYQTGEEVLNAYDATQPTIWIDFVVILGYAFLFKFVGFVFLWLRSRPMRQLA